MLSNIYRRKCQSLNKFLYWHNIGNKCPTAPASLPFFRKLISPARKSSVKMQAELPQEKGWKDSKENKIS